MLDDTTADLAFALLMAAARRISEGHEFIHAGQWKRWTIDLMIGHDIHHRTLGILGMGRIGQAMARRGWDFRCACCITTARACPRKSSAS